MREWAHREAHRLVHRDLPEIAPVHIDELLHARVRWKPDERRGYESLRAVFLDDLIAMFIERRWRPVDAEWAYEDRVYDRKPNILPAGESLIWGLAKETGRFDKELRYPGEDDVYENPKMDALKL